MLRAENIEASNNSGKIYDRAINGNTEAEIHRNFEADGTKESAPSMARSIEPLSNKKTPLWKMDGHSLTQSDNFSVCMITIQKIIFFPLILTWLRKETGGMGLESRSLTLSTCSSHYIMGNKELTAT